LRRFFVEELAKDKRLFSITGPEARHIIKVLRMEIGDQLILSDGRGARFLASIESASFKEVSVRLEESLPPSPPSPIKTILCQALLKSRNMDYVIQKTSELGVDSIYPFCSDRTVVRLDEDKTAQRMRHWRRVAQSSAKQCDRGVPAEIGPLLKFRELIDKTKAQDALRVIFWEEEDSREFKDLLDSSQDVGAFVGIVGPEGGFSKNEVYEAREAGFVSVTLGHRILRAETAAITMVALVQYVLGDLGRHRSPEAPSHVS
jgi:16S rRNA (uracil1498-N3)-methyltransferase